MKVIIGIGGSGSNVGNRLKTAQDKVGRISECRLLGQSPVYENPAVGGVTMATFANAAVVIDTTLSLQALWQKLHALERKEGRIRLRKNGARALDLDILWADATSNKSWLQVPHPRLLERDFALLPAIEAWKNAACSPPIHWELAARKLRPMSRMKLA